MIEHVKQKHDSKKIKPFIHDAKNFYRIRPRAFKSRFLFPFSSTCSSESVDRLLALLLKPSRPVGGKTMLLNPLPAQLEFIKNDTVVDGLHPITHYVVSAHS